jgi:hypothetical protein
MKERRMDINKTALAKPIMAKCKMPSLVAEIAAQEMIDDDFPMNGIKTMDEAIVFIDYVHDQMKSA